MVRECPYVNDVKNCIAVRRTGPPARCMNCKPGRENEEKAAEMLNNDIQRNASSHNERREKKMDRETLKNGILRVLGRKGVMCGSSLKNFAGRLASKEEFQAVIENLAGDGKIVTKDGARPGSLTVWLPGGLDTKSPEPGKKAAPPAAKVTRSSPATETSKKPRAVNRPPVVVPAPPDASGNKPPKNGGGGEGTGGTNYAALGDLHNSYASLVSALIEKDQAGIDGCLDDIALAALSWRCERRAAG